MRKFLDDFVNETWNELFPTRDAWQEFYMKDENFKRPQAGEIGDNLMYKYQALGLVSRLAGSLSGSRKSVWQPWTVRAGSWRIAA